MLDRRAFLHLTGLAGAALAAPAVLAGCSSTSSPDGSGSGSGGLRLAGSDVDREPGSLEAVPGAVAATGRLGGELLGALGQRPGNLVLSPYSVTVALAMTLLGARGRTAREMRQVLGVEDATRLASGLDALTRDLEALAGEQQRADGSTAALTLDAANTLFGQRDIAWEQGFLDALARYFGAGLLTVDFKTAAEQARDLVNGWTAKQTHDRITQILPPGAVGALTRLVLVDAVYLKAPWERPFLRSSTRSGRFHRADGSTVRADLMSALLEGVGYAQTRDWQAARLPYAGNGLAMTVVLPAPGAMGRTWDAVVGGGLTDLLARPTSQAVRLTLPRWTFRTRAPLTDTLSALGMPTAFDEERADLSGMTRQEPLHIDAVLHEAFIAVDEDGTEAAAATAVTVGTTSVPTAVEMTVSRPFLFAIHDVAHLTPLFVGRVDDPTG